MAKFDGVHAAYVRFGLQRSEDHRVDPVLPEDPGVVHAYQELLSFRVKPGHPRFSAQHEHWQALCGNRVKVLLPQRFETTDPSSCDACVQRLTDDLAATRNV
jgi:hypothetical protein